MIESEAQDGTDPLQELWDDDTQMDFLAREAVQEALEEHKRNGQSVVVWQDGRIVTLLPGEIPVSLPKPDVP